jgi:hypothetical protein
MHAEEPERERHLLAVCGDLRGPALQAEGGPGPAGPAWSTARGPDRQDTAMLSPIWPIVSVFMNIVL